MEAVASYERDVELTLGLPGINNDGLEKQKTRCNKRARDETNDECEKTKKEVEQPVAKAQVVGWPPVRSYRKNNFLVKKTEVEAAGIYVKVSMVGAPYLRKIDLKVYKGYKELREGLENMFKLFSLGDLSGMEKCKGSDYAITYEDKDGDWMLVGDVPWGMFISSCKRLRIMRETEARGLGSN